MNNLTINLSDIIETKTMINLPKQTLNWRRVIFFAGVLGILSISSSVLVSYLGPNFLYGEMITLTLLIITTCGMIFGGYGLVNELYQQPILVMTPSHIYIGLKIFLRSPRIVDRGIMPKEDLKLIIVKDSRSQRFRLILEGRQLLQLGVYNTLNEVELKRMRLKKVLTDFYLQIYISSPKYHEI